MTRTDEWLLFFFCNERTYQKQYPSGRFRQKWQGQWNHAHITDGSISCVFSNTLLLLLYTERENVHAKPDVYENLLHTYSSDACPLYCSFVFFYRIKHYYFITTFLYDTILISKYFNTNLIWSTSYKNNF